MKFIFTRHSRERCHQRGIRIADAKSTILSPDKIRVVEGGIIEATKKVRGKTLAVRFEVKKDIRKIITAFYED